LFWRTAPSVLAVRSGLVLLVVVTEDVGRKFRVGLLGLDLGLGVLLALLNDLWLGLTRIGRMEVFGSQSPHEAALSVPAWLRHGLAEDVNENIESPALRRDVAEPSEDDLPFALLGHVAGAVGWLGPRTRYSVAGDRAPSREAGP